MMQGMEVVLGAFWGLLSVWSLKRWSMSKKRREEEQKSLEICALEQFGVICSCL